MKKMSQAEKAETMRHAMDVAWERSGEPSLRDILKREYNDVQGRPRNKALEKWGPIFEAEIMRSMERERREHGPMAPARTPTPAKHPKKGGPDMDMD